MQWKGKAVQRAYNPSSQFFVRATCIPRTSTNTNKCMLRRKRLHRRTSHSPRKGVQRVAVTSRQPRRARRVRPWRLMGTISRSSPSRTQPSIWTQPVSSMSFPPPWGGVGGTRSYFVCGCAAQTFKLWPRFRPENPIFYKGQRWEIDTQFQTRHNISD